MRILPNDYRIMIEALHELLAWKAKFIQRDDTIDSEKFEAMQDVERIKRLIEYFSDRL